MDTVFAQAPIGHPRLDHLPPVVPERQRPVLGQGGDFGVEPRHPLRVRPCARGGIVLITGIVPAPDTSRTTRARSRRNWTAVKSVRSLVPNMIRATDGRSQLQLAADGGQVHALGRRFEPRQSVDRPPSRHRGHADPRVAVADRALSFLGAPRHRGLAEELHRPAQLAPGPQLRPPTGQRLQERRRGGDAVADLGEDPGLVAEALPAGRDLLEVAGDHGTERRDDRQLLPFGGGGLAAEDGAERKQGRDGEDNVEGNDSWAGARHRHCAP